MNPEASRLAFVPDLCNDSITALLRKNQRKVGCQNASEVDAWRYPRWPADFQIRL